MRRTTLRRQPIPGTFFAACSALVMLSGTAGSAAAQRPLSPPADSESATRRTLSTALYGDAAVVVNARGDHRIEIAAALASRHSSVAFAPASLRAWADSTAGLVARREVAPRSGERVFRSAIEESGLVSGGVSLTRRVSKSGSAFSLFFADTSFGGFAVPLTREEARVFVATIRRAATTTPGSGRRVRR